jgi:hypothetical protein
MNARKLNALGGIMALLLVLGWIGYDFLKLARLNIDHRFSIGTVVSQSRSGNGGPYFHYEFLVDGILYSRGSPPDENPKILGSRYYVKYLPSDPTISMILWDKSVSDSIQRAPKSGWENLPE